MRSVPRPVLYIPSLAGMASAVLVQRDAAGTAFFLAALAVVLWFSAFAVDLLAASAPECGHGEAASEADQVAGEDVDSVQDRHR